MILKFKSRIGKADTEGVSSRTIIPIKVIEALELDFGDNIMWEVDFGAGKIPKVTVSKIDKNSK